MINNKQYIVSQPGPNDVVCCKGTTAFYHAGNRQFRILVEANSSSYAEAGNNKMLKTQIVNSIIQSVFAAGGCFLSRVGKNGDQHFKKIKMNKTKEKVGHALRRAVATKNTITPSQKYAQFNTEQCISSIQKPVLPNLNLYQNFGQNFEQQVQQQVNQQADMVSGSHHLLSLYEPISIEKYSQQESETIDIQSAILIEDSLMEPIGIESSVDEEITSIFSNWVVHEE
mmetsp:Transcript_16225/g.24512  ORF Transcript_16225/g.24512 Transcript_16225/m.24512 type:complete len:227 (+) Transcript_16225:43-723(+)